MAQLVALMSGVVLGGVAEVVGSNLARGKIFTASIGSVDSLYPSVYIYIYITVCAILTRFFSFGFINCFIIANIGSKIGGSLYKYIPFVRHGYASCKTQ